MTETAPIEGVPIVNLNAESDYDVVDRRQSVNFINSTLADDPELQNVVLPLDPETQDLYQAMRSGVLILKLINAIEPGTISKDVIKKEELPELLKFKRGVRVQDVVESEPDEYIYKKNIIIETSLRKANDLPNPIIHKKITNTAGTDYSGNRNFKNVLALTKLLWRYNAIKSVTIIAQQIDKNNRGKSITSILLEWVNNILEKAGDQRRLTNFGDDIKVRYLDLSYDIFLWEVVKRVVIT